MNHSVYEGFKLRTRCISGVQIATIIKLSLVTSAAMIFEVFLWLNWWAICCKFTITFSIFWVTIILCEYFHRSWYCSQELGGLPGKALPIPLLYPLKVLFKYFLNDAFSVELTILSSYIARISSSEVAYIMLLWCWRWLCLSPFGMPLLVFRIACSL